MSVFNQLYARVWSSIQSLRDEDGQTMTEYAVLLGVVVVGAIAGLIIFRDAVTSALTDVANDI